MSSAVRLGREYVGPPPSRGPDSPAPDPAAHGGVIKFQTPEVVFGPESLAESGFAARRIGAQRPFVVTDPGLIEAGWPGELLRYLAAAGLHPTAWSGGTPTP